VSPEALSGLACKVAAFMPRLGERSIRRVWAGLRTLAPDGCVVIGEDPRVRGFHWCAGLGGHGVTASAAVGRLAADGVLGRPVPSAFSPARFAA
jgi:D-arginine dehydrogenase